MSEIERKFAQAGRRSRKPLIILIIIGGLGLVGWIVDLIPSSQGGLTCEETFGDQEIGEFDDLSELMWACSNGDLRVNWELTILPHQAKKGYWAFDYYARVKPRRPLDSLRAWLDCTIYTQDLDYYYLQNRAGELTISLEKSEEDESVGSALKAWEFSGRSIRQVETSNPFAPMFDCELEIAYKRE